MTLSTKSDEDFIWDGFKPWWLRHPRLRKVLSLPLYLINRNYRRWRNAKLDPRKIKKRMIEIERRFPRKKEDLIGREKEFEFMMSSITYHVIRDPMVRKVLQGMPPPKFFILKGSTGTGKTLLAEICISEAIRYGLKKGVNVKPIVVSGEDVFHPLYGQSIRNIGQIFDKAKETPSIIFFDEFQTVGFRVEAPTHGADREDIRVQDAFIEHINRIQSTQERCIVIAATNKFENLREDIRRRAYVIDLDQNLTRDILSAVLKAELTKYGWAYLDPEEVMKILEKAVTAYRQTQLSPFDIIDACHRVHSYKIEPLRGRLFKGMFRKREELRYKVTLEDFKLVARELRGYVEQEKSTEVMSTILKIKPAVSYRDVGGLFRIKEKLFKIISLSLRPELASKLNWVPPKGFLLWGEPGCGKTYLSKAIAKENNATFFYVPAAQLLINAKWVGEPEKNIRDLFSLARRHPSSIIFFDEFDVIAGKRKGDPISDRLTAQILTELDGLQPLENVIVIAATNRLDAIDEAVLNRFEPYIIEIPLPRNDEERLDIIRVHLRHYLPHLHQEVTPEKVLNVIKRFRAVSPRVAAEIIKEANRLRSEEVVAAIELTKAHETGNETRIREIKELYHEDLRRLKEVLSRTDLESLKWVTPNTYKIRLYHFEKAATYLESEMDKELMDAQEFLIYKMKGAGMAVGLATDAQGRKGMPLLVECSVSPNGSGKVVVTGAAKAVVTGPLTPIEDTSVIESAINVTEYVKGFVSDVTGIDISKYDFKFQVISPLEGMPGMGVSGPSLGVAFSVAAMSELSGIHVEPDVVMTGKGDIKGNVGPVGGLGWRGSGKIIAAVRTRKIRVKRFIIPRWNYERSPDEVKVLHDADIEVIPVDKQRDAWLWSLKVSEEELVTSLRENVKRGRYTVRTHSL